jgi:hypothetical protein
MSCRCDEPKCKTNPRHLKTCNKCGRNVSPTWDCTDENFNEFFDRLREALPGAIELDDFRKACADRERRGRHIFGHSYLVRDNIEEAVEEAADGANYAYFETLKNRRLGREDQIALALTAAQKFYEAYEALQLLRIKERGAPGPRIP